MSGRSWSAFGLALGVGCAAACGGGDDRPGIFSEQGDVALAVGLVDCTGPDDELALLGPLCGSAWTPLSWGRTAEGGVRVVIGDDVHYLEIDGTFTQPLEPEQEHAAAMAYVGDLVFDGEREALAGSLNTETLIPDCNPGRFRAGGTLRWRSTEIDVVWEAYPETGACDGNAGGGGAGGDAGAGGAGGQGGQ